MILYEMLIEKKLVSFKNNILRFNDDVRFIDGTCRITKTGLSGIGINQIRKIDFNKVEAIKDTLEINDFIIDEIDFGALEMIHGDFDINSVKGLKVLNFKNIITIGGDLRIIESNDLIDIYFPKKIKISGNCLFRNINIQKLDISNLLFDDRIYYAKFDLLLSMTYLILAQNLNCTILQMSECDVLEKIDFANTKCDTLLIGDKLLKKKIRYKGHCHVRQYLMAISLSGALEKNIIIDHSFDF